MKRKFLFFFCVAIGAQAFAGNLPSDVRAFIDKRDGCDHFRGEPWDPGDDPLVKDRREFILENINKLCTGTDKQLTELREKYRNNSAVIERLRQYEDNIESR